MPPSQADKLYPSSTKGISTYGHLCAQLNLSPRFRQIPTFGLDTIRRFSNDVSAMKKFAARDFEDLLQVAPYLELSIRKSNLHIIFRT
jgi:hypothetical protein